MVKQPRHQVIPLRAELCPPPNSHVTDGWASQVALVVTNPPTNAEDSSSIPGWGRSPGEGILPVFLPGDSHGQGSLAGATVHTVTKSRA